MAAEAAFGATTAWVSDIKPAAVKLLAHRHPTVPNLGDITKIDWSAVEPVDIITGGSPCQDLSAAGRRAGMTEGTRSNLWVNMREAIAALCPKWVVWENVRGAYSARADSDLGWTSGLLDGRSPDQFPKEEDTALRALGRVLGDLADLGYDAEWRGLRASDVGAPHGRFRVFLLATRRETVPDAGCLRGRTGWDAAPGQEAVGESLGEFGRRGRTPAAEADHFGGNRTGRAWDRWTEPANGSATSSDADDEGLEGHRGLHRPRGQEEVAPYRSSADPTRWGPFSFAISRWEQVVNAPAPSPVDSAGRLSPLLTEWMMGLPLGWITDVPGLTRSDQLSLAGDGVVPQQAYAAIMSCVESLAKKTQSDRQAEVLTTTA